MARSQLKRVASPRTWPIERKGSPRWIAKPMPGAHTLDNCLPVVFLIRDMLKLAKTAHEVKRVFKESEIMINNVRVKDLTESVGLFDVLTITPLNKHYRLVFTNRNKLILVEIKKDEASVLPLKVRSKSTLKNKNMQVNFYNGWNVLSKEKYAIDSTVLFDLSKKRVGKEISMKKGAKVVLVSGGHVGQLAELIDIKQEGALKRKNIATLKGSDGQEFATSANCLFVVGEKSPEFTAVVGNGAE